MNAYDAIRAAASRQGLALADIGRALGKRDNYIASMRGRNIGSSNLAAILAASGYALVAVPADEVPAGALVIDPAGDNQRDNADVLEAMRVGLEEGARIRQALEAGKISEATAGAACSAPPNGSGYRAVPRCSKDQTQ